MNNAYFYDFPVNGAPTSGTLAYAASTASVTLPAGIETLLLISTSTAHFRLTVGASSAVTTDPMIATGMSPIVVKLADPSVAYTLSAIQDTVAGNLGWAKVAEA